MKPAPVATATLPVRALAAPARGPKGRAQSRRKRDIRHPLDGTGGIGVGSGLRGMTGSPLAPMPEFACPKAPPKEAGRHRADPKPDARPTGPGAFAKAMRMAFAGFRKIDDPAPAVTCPKEAAR